jgi:hypothetical protein
MTNVFVSSEETRVIGGTSTVNVEVDFGPKGDRGNLFLVGYGNPNTITHNIDIQLLDIYINVQTTDEDYLVIYQYQNSAGVNTWVETGRLMTDKFSTNRTVDFEIGQSTSTVNFKLTSIVPISLLGVLTSANFNVQCTFSNENNPVAASIFVNDVTIDSLSGDVILPVKINAIEYVDGDWSLFSGTRTVHFLITVV